MEPILLNIPDEFESPRLNIRVPCAGDGPAAAAAILASRAELAPWFPWVTPEYCEADAEMWVRRTSGEFILRKQLTYAMFEKETGDFLGGYGPHDIAWKAGACQIGYWLRTDRVGRGLMSEALTAMCTMLFEHTPLRRIEVRCDVRNARSAAVAERCGFALDGILRSDTLDNDGNPRSTKVFSLIKP